MAAKTSTPRALYELLSSMRFAISLLTVIAIASIIGTVLKQNEPYPNYVFQFGDYWFQIFRSVGLYDVYHTPWFIVILTFLVASTSVCVYRNTPGMLREMRTYKEHASDASLRSFEHRAEFDLQEGRDAAGALETYLRGRGFHTRSAARGESGDLLIAAKKGVGMRVGYILTHVAIVIICVGGLLDGNIPLKLQESLGWKRIETRDIPQTQVPPESRLSPGNLSFRGNVTVPEGSTVDVIFQNVGDGYLVQELPFTIQLRKFHIDHYTTGQPKDFASDLVVTDKRTKESVAATIRVNNPLIFDGVAIYQASFGDGGTRLHLKAWDLTGHDIEPRPLEGAINQATAIKLGDADYRLEFSDFRPFNIENFGEKPAPGAPRLPGLSSNPTKKDLRNLGPAIQYKMRDAQGQAREFSNYMLPVWLEERWYYVTGMREVPNEPFRFMRIPADAEGRLDGFMQLRAVLSDPQAWPEIANRFAAAAFSGDQMSETMKTRLTDSMTRVLQAFSRQGFESITRFIENSVPKADQSKVADTYVRMMEGATFQALQISRTRAGKPPAVPDENTARFIRDSLAAMSDSFGYKSQIYLQLASFDEVKASGLQLTRSPGKNIVYLGCILLVLGVFAMFYIHERRMWLLLKPGAGKVLLAMSTNRKTVDFEQEFSNHTKALESLLKG